MGCVSAEPPDSNMGATEDQQGAENQQGVDEGSTCPGGYLFVPELGSCMPAACQGEEGFLQAVKRTNREPDNNK